MEGTESLSLCDWRLRYHVTRLSDSVTRIDPVTRISTMWLGFPPLRLAPAWLRDSDRLHDSDYRLFDSFFRLCDSDFRTERAVPDSDLRDSDPCDSMTRISVTP